MRTKHTYVVLIDLPEALSFEFKLIKTIPDGDVDTKYHGVFRMYTDIKKEWFEYELKFTDGNLVEVKRL